MLSFRPAFPKSIQCLLASMIVIVLSGCGQTGGGSDLSWVDVTPTAVPAEVESDQTTSAEDLAEVPGDSQTTDASTTDATPSVTGERGSVPVNVLSPEEMREHQPNEMGVILVLEYHVITTDPLQEAQFVRTADDMRADLAWLYENDFVLVSLSDVVDNTIDIPAGKRPVVLTFDDGTSSHLRYMRDKNGNYEKDENGDYVIDPNTAVGIIEAFYEEHPDFGRGGHFAPLIFNGFSYPEYEQDDLFEHKVKWLVENGYEIGNHTSQHTNLTDISNEEFQRTVAEPIVYYDELIGDVPGNASDILTLPFGTTPSKDLHPDQRDMMDNGYQFEGHDIYLRGALLVGANPMVSPANVDYHKLWIPRIQMFDESVAYWFGAIERGDINVYVSDGDPNTVTVPMREQPHYNGMLDVERVSAEGMTVVEYDPDTGEVVGASGSDSPAASPEAATPAAVAPVWRRDIA